MLFEYGASHFFCVSTLGTNSTFLVDYYRVSIPCGKVLVFNLIHKEYGIEIDEDKLSVDLVQINMVDFDIILDMD